MTKDEFNEKLEQIENFVALDVEFLRIDAKEWKKLLKNTCNHHGGHLLRTVIQNLMTIIDDTARSLIRESQRLDELENEYKQHKSE